MTSARRQTKHPVEMMECVGGVDPYVNIINDVAQIGHLPSEGMFGTDCYQHKHNNILQLQQICQANIDEIRSPILKTSHRCCSGLKRTSVRGTGRR